MDEDPTEIMRILLNPVIERPDVLAGEEAKHALFELTASLAGDDLNEPNFLLNGFLDDVSKGPIDIVASVVDLVEIQLEFQDLRSTSSCCFEGARSVRRPPIRQPELM
jgi:hypothetical protein